MAFVSTVALSGCGGSEVAVTSDAASDTSGAETHFDSGGADAAPTPRDAFGTRTPKNHRPVAIACTPSKGPGSSACDSTATSGTCRKDAECTEGINGKCLPAAGGTLTCHCSYDTCENDSHCSDLGPCACAGSPYSAGSNGCAPRGDCKVDADCGERGFCSPTESAGCGGFLGGYWCHTPTDECIDDDDCKATSGPARCTYDGIKKHWACTPILACD